MTYVLPTRDGDEKLITFPIVPDFQTFLKRIREYEPDRRWEILESWEL